jgi:manganese/zinc/iron transport system permease protein
MPAETWLSLFNDPAIRTVAGGAALIGATAGGAGVFAVVRRSSLQGDVVSHAALPGIATAVLLSGTSPAVMLLGGAVTGWLALMAVSAMTRFTRTTDDAALAIVLSTFFGAGLLLKSIVQRMPVAAESMGLDQFLFGQAAVMRSHDVMAIAIVGFGVLLVVIACWHRIKLVSFDPAYASSLGIRTNGWTMVLTTIIVAAAVVGLQAVGVVLMSALLVAPCIAARSCSDRFGAVGTLLTVSRMNLPTGPVIVLVAAGIVVLAIGFAGIRRRRNVSGFSRT